MELNDHVNDSVPFLLSERGSGREYYNSMRKYASDSGILNGIESFLKGLPDSVRKSLTAGEIADTILSMISDLRENARRELE